MEVGSGQVRSLIRADSFLRLYQFESIENKTAIPAMSLHSSRPAFLFFPSNRGDEIGGDFRGFLALLTVLMGVVPKTKLLNWTDSNCSRPYMYIT